MKQARLAVLVVLCVSFAAAALGQAPATSAPAPAPTGFRADFLSDVDFVSKRLVDLANAVPVDKYGWRPAPGVRSVSEVYMHVATANYMLPNLVGGKLPEGFDRGLETSVTDKAKVIDWLKKSAENAKAVASSISDADLDKKVKVPFLGGELSQRRILMIIQTHMHEHLGQSIAYARSNGVTPPWSEAEQPAPAKKG
ncbi:MAG: DinB family protein [Thermoanaerobaculia bacterium]